MSLSSAFANMQSLQELQSQQPTKKRVVEIRKSLIVVKKECDAMRKSLLSPKVEKSKVEAPPIYEVLPDGVIPVVITDNTSVKSPDTKLTEQDVSWQSPLPLTREVSVSVSSSEPVKSVTIKKTSKRQKKTKAQ